MDNVVLPSLLLKMAPPSPKLNEPVADNGCTLVACEQAIQTATGVSWGWEAAAVRQSRYDKARHLKQYALCGLTYPMFS